MLLFWLVVKALAKDTKERLIARLRDHDERMHTPPFITVLRVVGVVSSSIDNSPVIPDHRSSQSTLVQSPGSSVTESDRTAGCYSATPGMPTQQATSSCASKPDVHTEALLLQSNNTLIFQKVSVTPSDIEPLECLREAQSRTPKL